MFTVKDPDRQFKVDQLRVASQNQVWFQLEMNDLIYRSGGWISAISVYATLRSNQLC